MHWKLKETIQQSIYKQQENFQVICVISTREKKQVLTLLWLLIAYWFQRTGQYKSFFNFQVRNLQCKGHCINIRSWIKVKSHSLKKESKSDFGLSDWLNDTGDDRNTMAYANEHRSSFQPNGIYASILFLSAFSAQRLSPSSLGY
jgi:hypothetical protein